MARTATAEAVGKRQPGLRAPLLFALIFSMVFVLHAPLLRLPYFWDEAGYYVPAARDLLLTGDPIPHSSASSAHPPLVMAWLAAWWKLSGYTPAVARTAMLLVSAFALLGLFRLGRQVANTPVAIATILCTALYPVFFSQSSMAHLDLAAAALTFWALDAYVRGRRWPAVIFFALAALAKETAVIAPLALSAWEIAGPPSLRGHSARLFPRKLGSAALLLLPALPLAAWFLYHLHRTGHIFGDPSYFRYNVTAVLHPLRIPIAIGTRLWQLLGYMNLFVLSLAAAMAMTFPPVREFASRRRGPGGERRPIALPVQLVLLVVILTYVLVLGVIGGAVLARYMLPAVPLVILIFVSTLRRRLPWWPAVIAVVCAGFVVGLFFNPPWHFAPEDNLAYRDYVLLHKGADTLVAAKYPQKVVLTAWPASDELTRPWLRYVDRTVRVLRVDNFTPEQVAAAQLHRDEYDVVLAFSTKYEPRVNLTRMLPFWERLQTRFFDYHRDLAPGAIAQMLGGRIVYEAERGGQWVAVIDLEHVENAGAPQPGSESSVGVSPAMASSPTLLRLPLLCP